MRTLAIAALLAAAAPSASAGDVDVQFGFRSGGGLQIGIGYSERDRDDDGYRGYHRHGRRGHYDIVERKVWVPGYWTEVHHPAEYRWRRDHCGRFVKVLVRPARCEKVWVPGRWEVRTEKVYHQGSHRRHHHD